MRPIKTRTYYNFMRVRRMIEQKGYDPDTAGDITRRIFDEYEWNPNGLSVLDRVSRILPAEQFAALYGV